MILRVPFDHFAEEVRDRISDKHVYLQQRGRQCHLTASDSRDGVLILSSIEADHEEIRRKMRDEGFVVRAGRWIGEYSSADDDWTSEMWIAGVAFKGADHKIGLWLDAFLSEPSKANVLQAWYDELRETGELAENHTLEQLLNIVDPTVVILTPDEAFDFAQRKLD